MESSIILGALPAFIYVAAWTVAVVFAVKMSRHSGGRAERFLLIGTSLMLANSIVGCAWTVLYPWLIPNLMTISLMSSVIRFVGALISLGGIICLIYAFWHKFRSKQKPLMPD
jgi:protein-S-isoprenylcysteine O-methyltransferase Ste14